jgi:carbon-monoxide dehydrogenase medium subunit
MRPFAYVAAATVDEAVEVLARESEAKVLAGGQSLIPLLNYRLARPRIVVDINGLPVARIERSNGRLRLGALVRHQELADSSDVRTACSLLGEAAALIGNVRVRTLGTLGGSLAHADPAAELPLAMVALDAVIDVHGRRGGRTVAARDFFTGYLTTALAGDELVTAVDVPATPGMGAAVEEFSRRPGDFALVAVAAVVGLDRRGRVDQARVAIGGVSGSPLRLPAVEDVLRGQEPTSERLARAADAARSAIDPQSDAFASAGYRTLLAGVLTKRAIGRAVSRALEVS